MNGAPLPPQHGFPLRLVIAGWYGMAHVKWLRAITALTEPFEGYQQAVGYRMYDADGVAGRAGDADHAALADVPPGHPGLPHARARRSMPGRACLSGRAWSGWAPIARVEVSVDGGGDLGRRGARRAARRARVARLVVRLGRRRRASTWSARARPTRAGNVQPLDAPWNLKGYANNVVERVPVTVRG